MAFGVRTICISSLPPSTTLKWKYFNFDVLTVRNDEKSYVMHLWHVLDPLCVFFTPLVVNLHVVRLPS